jgi:hypothetical protein
MPPQHRRITIADTAGFITTLIPIRIQNYLAPKLRRRIILAHGGEDVEDLGVFEGRGLVLDAARDEEAVAGAGLEGAAGMLEADGCGACLPSP